MKTILRSLSVWTSISERGVVVASILFTQLDRCSSQGSWSSDFFPSLQHDSSNEALPGGWARWWFIQKHAKTTEIHRFPKNMNCIIDFIYFPGVFHIVLSVYWRVTPSTMVFDGRTYLCFCWKLVDLCSLVWSKCWQVKNGTPGDGTKSSIVEPYPLTKHRAGQIHPWFIPAKPTDLEGNVVISPHIPGEKVCKTWKGDNCTHLLETASVEKKYQAINSGQLSNPSILRLRCGVSGLRYVGEVSNIPLFLDTKNVHHRLVFVLLKNSGWLKKHMGLENILWVSEKNEANPLMKDAGVFLKDNT